MIAALIALLLAALVYAYHLPLWMARDDQRIIRQNGAADSLHGVFHRQRLTIRGALVLLGAAPWALAGWQSGSWWSVVGVLAYGLLAGAWFLRRFNSALNLSRDPPKPEWYVSLSPRASHFDQWLVARARRQLSQEINSGFYKRRATDAEVSARAAYLLERDTRRLLIAALAIGGPAYVLAAVLSS